MTDSKNDRGENDGNGDSEGGTVVESLSQQLNCTTLPVDIKLHVHCYLVRLKWEAQKEAKASAVVLKLQKLRESDI